jgi:predicted metalloprotease
MRWERGHTSGNVIDRRGVGGGRITLGRGGMRLGIGGLIAVGVLSLMLGRDLLTPLTGGGGAYDTTGATSPPQDEEMVQFVSFVLDDCQSTWRRLFAERGQSYRDARLVLFTSYVSTACGEADSGVGPFYCPPDEQLYVDLSFFRELRQRFGAPGDFAQAYVLAHEVGHHVQRLLGTEERVRQQMAARPDLENQLSTRTELQADCYAGVWARSTAQRQLLDPGDVEEAMTAAQAVGDDTLQRRAGRTVRPDTFTHGSSAQRSHWFQQGYATGRIESCDTFAASP